ncbi:MAG TPA: ATP synthase F1 subunit gamma [Prolixibacteraceae bacterium]|nr:ATP synthase F1 subunit gamma [Prolixibacteraceae bacterium]
MANLKDIRTRIASVKSTQKVTSAMKMVSAAKLRKAQDAIHMMRPYAEKLNEILTTVSSNLDSSIDNKYAFRKDKEKILIVAITSNRGLCGGFNSNVVKRTAELYYETYQEYSQKGKVDVIAIGKKGVDGLKSKGIKVTKSFLDIYDGLNFMTVTEITQCFMEGYTEGIYDHIEVVYNQFKNAAVQNLITEQFLPVKTEEISEVQYVKGEMRKDYIFEPSMQEIADIIIPQTLRIQFFKAILDSVASEHGARMTAMHKATDNAGVLIRELKLKYNQARQAAITNEILEIVSGANAQSS